MEFAIEHPLVVLQVLTALVSFAAGFTTYQFGWRRARRSNQSGSGGQQGLLSQLRRQLRPRSHKHVHFPYFVAALVANEEAWQERDEAVSPPGTMLA